jgi:hypothetical protein
VDEPLDPVNIVLCSALSVAACLGIRRGWKERGREIFPCLAVILFFPFIYYLTHPFPYYRQPADPEIVLFAAFAVWPVLSAAWKQSRTALMLHRLTAHWKPARQPVPVLAAISHEGQAE